MTDNNRRQPARPLRAPPVPARPASAELHEQVRLWAESQLAQPGCHHLYTRFLDAVEPQLLAAVMRDCANNQSRAAAVLGVNRGTLRSRLTKYDLLDVRNLPADSA